MDGVMLGYVCRELNAALAGGRVDKVSQPEKCDLAITVRSRRESHILLLTANPNSARCHITRERRANPLEPSAFCMLMRKHLVNSRVLSFTQINGDRVMEAAFEGVDELGDRLTRVLICEFMGKHSNLILTAGGKIMDSARRVDINTSRVREVLPGLPYRRPPSQGKLPYDGQDIGALETALCGMSGALDKALSSTVSGLSIQTARELIARAGGDGGAIIKVLNSLPHMTAPTVYYNGGAPMDVTPFPFITLAHLDNIRYDSVSEALDQFYASRDRADRIREKSASLFKSINNNISRCERKLGLQMEALAAGERMEEYRARGELITANLHMIKKGAPRAELPNYYDPGCALISIELDVKLSPAANAQRYFKLYQKAKSARELAAGQKATTEEELSYLYGQLGNLENCEGESELNEIRDELTRLNYLRASHNRRQIKKLPASEPLAFTSAEGVKIYVGKNNVQNEKLTAAAKPLEWWLHAKNMPGSHVIVTAEEPNNETIGQAASLAAYYSKGRNDNTVPVDMTRRKYVKKPNGARPGFMIYTNQRTLYAQPRN
jgi:predicted ribosome quality control (RQC) complex YloA/Tae2 family protein